MVAIRIVITSILTLISCGSTLGISVKILVRTCWWYSGEYLVLMRSALRASRISLTLAKTVKSMLR